MGSVSRAVVLSGVRTPIGRYGGALSGERPDDLAGLVIAGAVARSGVDADEIEDVYFGCARGCRTRSRASPSTGCAHPASPRSRPPVTR
jgi:acetyl-CoA acetyltransferase